MDDLAGIHHPPETEDLAASIILLKQRISRRPSSSRNLGYSWGKLVASMTDDWVGAMGFFVGMLARLICEIPGGGARRLGAAARGGACWLEDARRAGVATGIRGGRSATAS